MEGIWPHAGADSENSDSNVARVTVHYTITSHVLMGNLSWRPIVHRYLLMVLLFTSSAFGQTPNAADLRTAAGCGPAKARIDVKTDKKQHAAVQSEPGKALVFVVTEYESEPHLQVIGHITTRVGLDGNWVGANHQGSAFSFPVEPGAHRICSDLQSSAPRAPKLSSAIDLVAEPGVSYYYRIVLSELRDRPLAFRLEPLEVADGILMASKSSRSTSKIKN